MIEVGIFTADLVKGKRLGGVKIAPSPLKRAQDFHCAPIGMISFKQAQEIDAAIDRGETHGAVDGMEWRRE